MDSFRENGKSRFLRIECGEKECTGYEAKMMIHNRPEGLLPMQIYRENDACYCEYNVSGLASLKDMEKSGSMGRYIYSVLEGMYRVSDIIHEYFLNPENIVLDPEHIYLRAETGSIYFCYLPGHSRNVREMLMEIMEYFMRFLNPTGEDDVLLLYGLYQKTREENVTLKTLFEYWKTRRESDKDDGKKGEKDYIEAGYSYGTNENEYRKSYKEAAYEMLGLEDEKTAPPDYTESLKSGGNAETYYSETSESRSCTERNKNRLKTAEDDELVFTDPDEEQYSFLAGNPGKSSKTGEIHDFIMKYKVELMVGGAVLLGAVIILMS